ncbi:hypothetical protein FS837_000722, partial [Tulasnella sp. UAMH 9824]
MATRLQEKLTTIPDIPKEFGDDGGHFYRYYDELAEEIDEDLVKSLKAQLDGILIFVHSPSRSLFAKSPDNVSLIQAGLFAGVNSAFLALTLPQMSPDLAEDTNALLLQIALGGNSSITSAADLPSASFTPPPRIYPINVLFSVSLTLALFSSFLAVLGQQWIVYYRKRGGGGPEYQRWEQLRRYLGAKRWRLELVLDDLVPTLLQLGLVIFCTAFALYLGTLSQFLNRIIAWILCAAAATILAMSTWVAFDPWCPFKLPWSGIMLRIISPIISHIPRPMASAIAATLTWLVMRSVAFILTTLAIILWCTWYVLVSIFPCLLILGLPRLKTPEKIVTTFSLGFDEIHRWWMSVGVRPEGVEDLKVEALKRVMCTSEDRNALIYSAVNLQVIRDQRALSSLAKDEEFRARLSSLQIGALLETQQEETSGRNPFIEARAFSSSFFHLILGAGIVGVSTQSRTEAIALNNVIISPSLIHNLYKGSTIHSNARCDQCSQCMIFFFSITVVNLVFGGFVVEDGPPPELETALRGLITGFKKTDDLRLGCMLASGAICLEAWGKGGKFTLLEELFRAYWVP